ncbi:MULTISPECIES: aminotransferase class I/II-fold pyridoxal phosphate-dependent enzyme [Rhizobium/Agrobacterium group]|uniref:Transcriptional regulator with HTH domain and aminotransferase domain n=1 Tax=Agrobacterium tumefaciens str. Kerr 14 TaxID=1183424 RepID=A0A1S7SDI6_AGRTU|nr:MULTISPECIES: aminotransferase class I/II-fold pyridoxal phosphate-dependent enzyme [Rhizobium/Agrobacterium group]NTF97810.1 aminotransferase class I/II-fold pyridoxal phosphate-dependent enzyme [Rhizobium rhizogenes]CUX66998.1 Transcriptional regulator with HTH domain and aminotransferase domain [Agrobacterium tumefaciens str. Kerr 14]
MKTALAAKDIQWLTSQFSDCSAHGIHKRMVQLIREGYLLGGSPLPTVRDFARGLGVSTGSVAEAWSRLREDKLILTNRRGGSSVAVSDIQRSGTAKSSASLEWFSVDLAQGLADPALQPQLGPALMASLASDALHAPENEAISEALVAAAMPTLPFKPEAWCASGGGTEGALLAFEAATNRGDVVAVEEPTSPRILEALKSLEVTAVPVLCDKEGPLPDSLKEAFRYKPSAFIYQPRAQVPIGHRVSDRRIKELAEVLLTYGPEVVVVEDDNLGPVAMLDVPSIGLYIPERVLHVRAYCKTYGVDLRTSIIAGSSKLVDRARQVRSHGTAMTSRILQNAVAFLIADKETDAAIDLARRRYAQRRQRLHDGLRTRGMPAIDSADGFGIWLPVADEVTALLNLASFGVSVGAGSKYFTTPSSLGHLRIATSRLPDDPQAIDHLSEIFLKASLGGRRLGYE